MGNIDVSFDREEAGKGFVAELTRILLVLLFLRRIISNVKSHVTEKKYSSKQAQEKNTGIEITKLSQY
jgi:hypothetical protein